MASTKTSSVAPVPSGRPRSERAVVAVSTPFDETYSQRERVLLCLVVGLMTGGMTSSDQRAMGLREGILIARSFGLDKYMARDLAQKAYDLRQSMRLPFDGMMG